MSGFKLKEDNILIEYFGTSNTLKLSVVTEDVEEDGTPCFYNDWIYIEPHSKELETLINLLIKAKDLL